MSIKIYNTLTRKKEDFQPLIDGKVGMYVCGPTVYSNAHVGHAMSALVFDIIRRYFAYRSYQVKFVMNYTDVDDKIIRRANEQGADPFKLAEGYIQQYAQNMIDLNVLPASVNPRATQEMGQIIEMISGLIEKGYAYAVDGDVYFRVDATRITASSRRASWRICRLGRASRWTSARCTPWISPCGNPPNPASPHGKAPGDWAARAGISSAPP